MIKSAYAVVHFGCDVPNCTINDTWCTEFKNPHLEVFEVMSPDMIWDEIKSNDRLKLWTLKDGDIRCPYHTNINPPKQAV